MFLGRIVSIAFWTAVVILAFSPLYAQSETEANNTKLMKRFYDEVANQGKFNLIDELVGADFVDHEEFPGMPSGKEGLKAFFKMFRSAFPDLKFTVHDMVARGDKVWARLTISGTQKGEFMDMPASGKKMEVQAFDIVRFKNGKAVEHWGLTDSMMMMQQLTPDSDMDSDMDDDSEG